MLPAVFYALNTTAFYSRKKKCGRRVWPTLYAPAGIWHRYNIGPRRLRLIMWPCNLDLWPWQSWHLWLKRVVVLRPYTQFEVRRPCRSEDMAHDVCQHYWAWWPWHLTLKLVCESHQRWETFLPNLGTLDLWLLELFAMYATDGQTDGQKQRLLPPSLRARA